MACGCTQSCGCIIEAGPGVTVQRIGDTIIISAVAEVGVPIFIQHLPPMYTGGPYVWWETDGAGNLVTQWVETNGA